MVLPPLLAEASGPLAECRHCCVYSHSARVSHSFKHAKLFSVADMELKYFKFSDLKFIFLR